VHQSSFPIHFAKPLSLICLLLVTIYFGLSRRNPSTGLLLGMGYRSSAGQLEWPDGSAGALRHRENIIGYLASSIGARLDTEHPAARFALTFAFFITHQGLIVITRRILLAQPEPWFNMHLIVAALVNALVAVFLFLLLDRLRKN